MFSTKCQIIVKKAFLEWPTNSPKPRQSLSIRHDNKNKQICTFKRSNTTSMVSQQIVASSASLHLNVFSSKIFFYGKTRNKHVQTIHFWRTAVYALIHYVCLWKLISMSWFNETFLLLASELYLWTHVPHPADHPQCSCPFVSVMMWI